MKDILKILFMFCIVVVIYIYKDPISNFITDDIINHGSNKVLTYNEYFLDNDYSYVKNIDNKYIKNYQDVLNIFYTVLNSGDNNFSFYCDYNECINDVKKLMDANSEITEINNFVHPFNSFSSINIDIANSGKVTIKVKKLYSERKINYIEQYINDFISSNINNQMSNYDKIKLFHDFVLYIHKIIHNLQF